MKRIILQPISVVSFKDLFHFLFGLFAHCYTPTIHAGFFHFVFWYLVDIFQKYFIGLSKFVLDLNIANGKAFLCYARCMWCVCLWACVRVCAWRTLNNVCDDFQSVQFHKWPAMLSNTKKKMFTTILHTHTLIAGLSNSHSNFVLLFFFIIRKQQRPAIHCLDVCFLHFGVRLAAVIYHFIPEYRISVFAIGMTSARR